MNIPSSKLLQSLIGFDWNKSKKKYLLYVVQVTVLDFFPDRLCYLLSVQCVQ